MNYPYVNRDIDTDSTIEEMLMYHNLGMEINGLTNGNGCTRKSKRRRN